MPAVRQKGRKMCEIVWLGGLSYSRARAGRAVERYYNVRLKCGTMRAVYTAYYALGRRVNCPHCTTQARVAREKGAA